MQVLAINPVGTPLYLHVNKIKSPILRKRYGKYTINFFNYPNAEQASDELVYEALVSLMVKRLDWKFQVL